MTRKLIAKEGILSEIPNTWLALGSLRIDYGAQLPVTVGFEFSTISDIAGWAGDLQRDDETGEVTVEITLHNDAPIDVDNEEYDYTFYATEVVSEQVKATDEVPAHRLITSARLRGVVIVPIAALPRRHSQKLQGP
jgi:hypothetical protein